MLNPEECVQPPAEHLHESAGGHRSREEAEPQHKGEDGPHLQGDALDPSCLHTQRSESAQYGKLAEILKHCTWPSMRFLSQHTMACINPGMQMYKHLWSVGQPHEEADAGAQLADCGGTAHRTAHSQRPAWRPGARAPRHQVSMHAYSVSTDRDVHSDCCDLQRPAFWLTVVVNETECVNMHMPRLLQ